MLLRYCLYCNFVFFFFSCSYVVCPTAKIFRMPDPVRLKGGQRTLEQLQITDDDDEEDRTTSWEWTLGNE